jgi:RNA polymerase sigma-70 factor (ECF subfamily)
LERLLETHHDRVYALCRRMLADEHDAQDAVQDALIAAVRALPRFDGRSSFSTWMYRIATNTCIDEMRRRRRRPVVGFDDPGHPVASAGGLGSPSAPDPADSVAGRVDLDAALQAVPTDFRAAVVLRDLCDLSYEEIAGVLEVPLGTVRSRIARGRGALADLLTSSESDLRPGSGSSQEDLGNSGSAAVVRSKGSTRAPTGDQEPEIEEPRR